MSSKTAVTAAGETHSRKPDTRYEGLTAQAVFPGRGTQALSLDIETRLKE